ncbi:MAG: hypothetical protein AAB470_01610 [Patescibacteria group bacterium]
MKSEKYVQLAPAVIARFNLSERFLDSIRLEYGSECLDIFLNIADKATSDSNLSSILEEAIQKAYPEQFLLDLKVLNSVRFGANFISQTRCEQLQLFGI